MFASDDMYSDTLENFRVFGDNGIILNARYKKRNDIFFYEYSIDSIEHSDDDIYINLKREVYSDFEGTIPFLEVPVISKDWFTIEWCLNYNNQSYRFKVRSIEYTDDRVMIRIIDEEQIDSDYPTSFYSGGTIRGKIPYDEFIKTFHIVIDE